VAIAIAAEFDLRLLEKTNANDYFHKQLNGNSGTKFSLTTRSPIAASLM